MVVQSLYPNDVRVRRQAESLARTGVRVDIICLQGKEQPFESDYEGVTAYRVMPEASKESVAQYMWVALRFLMVAFAKLQSLSIKNHYELIQVHNMPDFLVFASLSHKLMGRPVVLDLHDLSVELMGSKWGGAKSKVLTPIIKAVEYLSCGLADRLITTSGGFRDRLIERGIRPDKITLVMNTADPRIFKFQEDRTFAPITRGAKLLYHGTVAPRFGLAKAIDAVALLQAKIPDSTLNIYGQYYPSYKEELEDQIKQLNLQDKVFLHGWKTHEEVCEIIRNSDIGLVPYMNDDFMRLAHSTKTFEYAATGLPVVASGLESIRSVLTDECVRFVDPDSAQDMADKIAELCLDPELRQRQTQAALAALPEISWPVMMERYLDLMHGLIGMNGKGK